MRSEWSRRSAEATGPAAATCRLALAPKAEDDGQRTRPAPEACTMSASEHPSPDESFDRLRRAGWSIGDIASGPEHALVWLVTGTNGENRIEAHGRSQSEAWWRACEQARSVGMLAPTQGGGRP